MRLRLSLIATALGLCLPGTAGAAPVRWEGTLSLQVAGIRSTPDAAGGGVATVNGSAGLGHLTTLAIRGGIAGSGIMSTTDPDVVPLTYALVSETLGSGVLRPISGAATSGEDLTQNVLPMGGELVFCVIFGCFSRLPVPLTVGGSRGMGIGGLVTVRGYGSGPRASFQGAPWTIGVASVTGLPTENGGVSTTSLFGFVHAPASSTSSTARIGGVVQLVTPAKLLTTFGTGTVTPIFGILTIHFVPEPSTAALVGVGLLGLWAAGRRRAE